MLLSTAHTALHKGGSTREVSLQNRLTQGAQNIHYLTVSVGQASGRSLAERWSPGSLPGLRQGQPDHRVPPGVSACAHTRQVSAGLGSPKPGCWSEASPMSRHGGSGLSSGAALGRAGAEDSGEGVAPAASPS